MAWFRNHYECDRCGGTWEDDWSCMCDDDCPRCGSRHMSPYESDDLTDVIETDAGGFVLLRSPDTAEHTPDYYEVGTFSTRQEAEAHLATLEHNDGPTLQL